MKFVWITWSALLLVGCAGTHKKGTSHYDPYDGVIVDQMVGNNVSGKVFEKTIVCLNARRESRRVTAVTNISVATVTNAIVSSITNQTVSQATNYVVTVMTNVTPLLPATLPPGTGEAGAPLAAETNVVVVVTNLGPSVTTNVTVSLATNQSLATTPSQTAANTQVVRNYNNQITTTSNNLTVSLMTNQIVTAETNQVINYVTNYSLAAVTNMSIAPTNLLAREYFLCTELVLPPDFTLQTGESLVLLVDGVRHGFSQSPSSTVFVGRKGYTSGLYRVPPELLVAIANAKEVSVRIKGANSLVEKTMNTASKQHFKAFLLNYFTPGQEAELKPSKAPAKDRKKSKSPAQPQPGQAAESGTPEPALDVTCSQ